MKILFLRNTIASNRPLLIVITAFLALGFVLFSCGKTKQEKGSGDAAAPSGDYYLFSPDEEHVLRVVQPIRFLNNATAKTILAQLGKHLETGYFSETSDGRKTNIMFNVEAVHHVNTPGGPFRIGVVNMIDQNEIAKSQFFQGSFGGRAAFYMIAATYLQPQNAVPLLDGLILLYNKQLFPEMVHIDFTGIVTPKYVRPLVLQAVNKVKSEK